MKYIIAALVALLSTTAQASQELVGFASTSQAAGVGTTITLPSFVVPAHTGASHILVKVCTEDSSGASMALSSVTWGSNAGSEVGSTSEVVGTRNSAFLWIIPDVAPGTATVTVTMPLSPAAIVAAAVLHDSGTQEAVATSHRTSTSVSTNVTTLSADALVVDLTCHSSSGTFTVGAMQTQLFNLGAAGQTALVSTEPGPGVPGTTTMSWSGPSGRWAQVAASFPKELPSCAGGCDRIPGDTLMINMLSNAYSQCAGVVGDGVHDDTAAINACLTYWGPTGILQPGSTEQRETLYFPAGTYRITNTLRATAEEDRQAILCAPGAKFVLDDGAAGFGDICTPKPIVRFGSPASASAFENAMEGCEINTGLNPGANGIDYAGNNAQVYLRNNWIHGEAFNTGIIMSNSTRTGSPTPKPNSGPAIFKGNLIQGGRYGIFHDDKLFSLVLEDNTTLNQSIAGTYVTQDGVTIVNPHSVQTDGKPGIFVAGGFFTGSMSILGGDLTNSGGSNSTAIVVEEGTGQPRVFARSITTTGYTNAIQKGATTVAGGLVTEWASHPIHSVFTSTLASLNLPVLSHPHHISTNAAEWANLCSLTTCNGTTDNTAALQALINDPSGPKTIYCSGRIAFTQIDVPPTSNLERLVGYDCQAYPFTGATGPWITVRSNKTVEIQNLNIKSTAPQDRIYHNGTGDLVITDVTQAFPYRCAAGSGDLYVEDSSINNIETCGNDLIARQLNLETGLGAAIPKLRIVGGTARVYGFKTEDRGTSDVQVKCSAGAQCEIFGGFYLGATGLNTSPYPLQECNEASCFFTWATTSDNPINPIQARAVRGGVTADLLSSTTWNRGQGEVGVFVERP